MTRPIDYVIGLVVLGAVAALNAENSWLRPFVWWTPALVLAHLFVVTTALSRFTPDGLRQLMGAVVTIPITLLIALGCWNLASGWR